MGRSQQTTAIGAAGRGGPAGGGRLLAKTRGISTPPPVARRHARRAGAAGGRTRRELGDTPTKASLKHMCKRGGSTRQESGVTDEIREEIHKGLDRLVFDILCIVESGRRKRVKLADVEYAIEGMNRKGVAVQRVVGETRPPKKSKKHGK